MRRRAIGFVVCMSVILLCCSCSSATREQNSEPYTAILGAFEKEIIMLQDELAERQEQRIEGMRFVSGKLNGKRAVIAWTGIGKVNAAMTTTLLIQRFQPNEVIFTGIAGAVNPELSPGDVVIAAKTAQHDLGVLTEDGIENAGVINPVDGIQNPVFFQSDGRLLQLAQKAAGQVALEAITTDGGQRIPRIVKGVIVTGDLFGASVPKRAELHDRLAADAVEMEGAAVAQICHQRSVPCIVIRGVSDMADEKALADVQKNLETAATNSAAVTAKLVELLASEYRASRGKSLRESND